MRVAHPRVELVHGPNPLRGKVRLPFLEDGEHRGLVVGARFACIALQGSHAGRGGRVDRIVLPTSAPRELPHPSRRRGRDIEDRLITSDEPLREVQPKPFAFSTTHRRFGN
jgi:hypothetical protein